MEKLNKIFKLDKESLYFSACALNIKLSNLGYWLYNSRKYNWFPDNYIIDISSIYEGLIKKMDDCITKNLTTGDIYGYDEEEY